MNPLAGVCTGFGAGNITGVPAALDALADNGGPTLTHMPLGGSPAINAGANCAAIDQRGANRPFGASCDIGAVENGATKPPNTFVTIAPPIMSSSGDATFEFGADINLLPGGYFECRVDTGFFTVCNSPYSISGIPNGLHTFDVRAVNAGVPNATPDPTHASYTWLVNVQLPSISINNPSVN